MLAVTLFCSRMLGARSQVLRVVPTGRVPVQSVQMDVDTLRFLLPTHGMGWRVPSLPSLEHLLPPGSRDLALGTAL